MGLACFYNPSGTDDSLNGATTDGPTTATPATDSSAGDTSSTPTTSTTTASTTTTSTATTSTAGVETEPQTSPGSDTTTGCRNDAECLALDPDNAFCVDAQCTNCAGAIDPAAACEALDPSRPVCDLQDGRCVTCTPEDKSLCSGNTPICDPGTGECVACREHADCGTSACANDIGYCFDPGQVIWVDSVAVCDTGDGTEATPFCQITQALDEVSMGNPGLGWTIRVKTGNYIQPSLLVPPGAVLAILGDGGVAKIRSTTAATLQVSALSRVYLSRLNLASNANDTGLTCQDSVIVGDELTFSLNRQGYVGTGCDTTFRRSVFYKNTSGGLTGLGSGRTRLINSYISNNGSNAEADHGGILSGQGHDLELLYTAVINNLAESGARSLRCDAAGDTTIRNSVIIAFVPPSMACPLAFIEHSAIDEGKVGGDSNIAAVMADAMTWFEPQVGGVYKARPDTALATVAEWRDGDPATDFNGDPRPDKDGALDQAGADRPDP
ncbi:hypothetical protein [Nannocystis punicea]|uniref:Right handed beta helix domain-containing protein n=1 Tax=Nannocystis punicea TaxID=2995304 RepID=A0ABY7HB12_9BACT|nr:hypothetical protein [Nannocystis poenicansa]WAS96244.1 hypothetical protein O0S08_08775 [Nannocystis poenicansa]